MSGGQGGWRVFWERVEGALSNMARWFEVLVDRLQSSGSVAGALGLLVPSSMDTLNTLLVAWLVFALLVVLLGYVFYVKVIKSGSKGKKPKSVVKTSDESAEVKSGAKELTGPVVEPCKDPTIVPAKPIHDEVPVPVATGADPDAVLWTNTVFKWLFSKPDGAKAIREAWLNTINEFTHRSAIESGVLLEVVQVYDVSPPPTLRNVVVDCQPSDNMTITCDCEATLYLKLVLTRTQGETTTESDYACAVEPLRGRLNIAAITEELMSVVKFDGWPEVSLKLEGLRNNSKGLDEDQLQEVITELLTSGLRNVVIDLNFKSNKTFPRFKRARVVPDPVIPVGYDSMVRERQTHPPSYVAKPTKATKPKSLDNDTHHNVEVVKEAGESFTSISIPSSLTQQALLTNSEELLVAQHLKQYKKDGVPLIPVIQLPDDEDEEMIQGSWEENYVPASPVPDDHNEGERKVTEPNGEVGINGTVPESTTISRPLSTVRTTQERQRQDQSPDMIEGDTILSSMVRRPLFVQEKSNEVSEIGEIGKEASEDLDEGLEEDEEDLKPLLLEDMEYIDTSLPMSPSKAFPGLGSSALGQSNLVTAQQTSEGTQSEGIQGLNGKRLLVKIVKATGIGCETEIGESYAVVEMDEPPQKFTTSVIKDTNSPFWDEQFLFDMSDGTLELLFEIYDKKDNRFFGLGIVGIEELVATPSQRQIIPLQARPYENDPVSGSLTVEFLFLDRAELPDFTLRSSATTQSLSAKGDLITTTTTTYTKSQENQEVLVNGGDSVAAAVLRDIEEKKAVIANANASKSTMIIHASRKPEDDLEPTDDVTAPLISTATDPPTTTTATVADNQAPTTTGVSTDLADPSIEPADNSERGRSRSSRRKRDSFFGTLKKRFSRSKVRSKSMDPNARDVSLDGDASVGRSVSMERSTNVARSSGLLSVPRTTGGDGGSTRSSISEAESGVSGSSTRTYVNEASTLIVEAEENGIIKHYLIPLSLQQRSKWRKKGIKLHVYNEHIFVAKHMSSSTPCQVCQKTLGRRFGKQGYECRDCGFKCHKPCHVKTDTICPNSTINSMDLEIVKDHREERRSWLRKAKNS